MHKQIKLHKGAKITVVGDIHERISLFNKLLDKIELSKDHLLISLGDVYDKGDHEDAERICYKLSQLVDTGLAHVVIGNHESRLIRKGRDSPGLRWFTIQPTSITITFSNNTKVLIVHAGVTPKHTIDDLSDNIEVMMVRYVDDFGYIPVKWKKSEKGLIAIATRVGVLWHEKYDGRFGYIISGHNAQDDGIPKFYKHSCNIDTKCYKTGILTAITYTENGREEIIQIS